MIWQIIVSILIAIGAAYRAIRSIKLKSLFRGPQLDPFADPDDLPDDVHYIRLKVLGTSHIGVYYSEPIYGRPWIVYCHGIMNNCEYAGYPTFTHLMPYANVVTWDYRGFGRSTGESDETVVLYDLHYILSWLHKTHEPKHVILVGSSLGSNIVLQYISNERHFLPNSVVLINPFYALSDVFLHMGFPSPLAYIAGNMQVADVLPKFLSANNSRHALILGTCQDTITPWKRANEVKEKCPPLQVEIKDVGGLHFAQTLETWNAINEFVKSINI